MLQVTEFVRPIAFWSSWLLAVCLGVVAFGLFLVVAPGTTREAFALLVYGDTRRIATFGAEANAYIALLHAVLGGVMVGWGIALFLAVRGPFARGQRVGWQIVAVSVIAWFVPDTAFSVWSGFWPNAALNLAFLGLFAMPLVATYRTFHAA